MTSKAVAYVRVSTAEQAREGVSLEAQRARIEAHCKAQGHDLEAVYADEGISGRKTSNRPALEEALKHACRIKGTLVVYSLSRLARSTKDAISIAERVQKSGAQLSMLAEQVDTSSAAGKMFYAVLSALSQFEVDQLSERTAMALRHKKGNGERWCCNAPFGWTFRNGRVEQDSVEQRVLRRMQSLRTKGLCYREIAQELREAGVMNRAGRPFRLQSVAVILTRPRSALPPACG